VAFFGPGNPKAPANKAGNNIERETESWRRRKSRALGMEGKRNVLPFSQQIGTTRISASNSIRPTARSMPSGMMHQFDFSFAASLRAWLSVIETVD